MSDNIDVKYFIHSILRFLKRQLDTKTLTSDAAESLEVAVQCLENAYNLDTTIDDEQSSSDEDTNPLNHVDLYQLFLNSCFNITPEKKEEAETLKNEGNHLMKLEKYQEALVYYNRAINLDATNPVFYCNRAAAFSKLGELQKAIDDCKMSLRYDQNYSKAYGRLGLAFSKLNRHEEAQDAYRNALRIEPNNVDYQNNLAVTQERLKEASHLSQTLPDLNAAAASVAGGNGVPPNVGNIDFAAALNNPTLMNLATRMMTEPGMQDLLVQLSGLNNMNALLETGRQLAFQMYTENPDLFSGISQQIDQTVRPNGGDPTNQPTPPTNDTPENQEKK